MQNLIVLISGEGTNLQAIIDACDNKIINGKVMLVVSNKQNAKGLDRAKNHNIESYCSIYDKKKILREDYDKQLIEYINNYDYDLIVCAGWMHLLSNHFLNAVKSQS
jgi:phosphoribosylglycinamide formyltransferase 1